MRSVSRRFVAIVLMLMATAAALSFTDRRRPEYLVQPLHEIPAKIADWTATGADEALDPLVLKRLKPTDYLARYYAKNGYKMGLFISFYAEQRSGESMHSPKNCLPGSGWEIWKREAVMIPTESGPVEINKYFIQNSGRRMLVMYWYQSKRRIVASEYLGKILLVRDALLENHTSGSIVRITLADDPTLAAEGERIAAAVIPEVQRCFGD